MRLPPQERYQLVARLNGLFGGIFAGESFSLSQSYYYGRVAGNEDHRVEYIEGHPIDTLVELDEIALGKPNWHATPNGHATLLLEARDPEVWIDAIKEGRERHNNTLALVAHMVNAGHRDWVIQNLLDGILPHGEGNTRDEVPEMIRSARAKWNVPNGVEEHRAEQPEDVADLLSLRSWLERDLPEPDMLLGPFSTTSRAMFVADTGLGKTNLAMGIAFAMASGQSFLHWEGKRPASVLYIDGEMSRRLFRQRIRDAISRCGEVPERLHLLSVEDFEGMQPLNTKEGQQFIEKVIDAVGGVDFVIFDNIQALLTGDMKDEEPWQQTLPWVRSITRRGAGQLWIHHTGHDKTRSYGTKTREWQLNSVMVAEATDRDGADLAFSLRFTKNRERSPENRGDYDPVTITLSDNQWIVEGAAVKPQRKGPSPLGLKFYEALLDAVVVAPVKTTTARLGATNATWMSECTRRGIVDAASDEKAGNRNRALLSKYRRELVACDWVACNSDISWSIR